MGQERSEGGGLNLSFIPGFDRHLAQINRYKYKEIEMPSSNFNVNGSKAMVKAAVGASIFSEPTKAYLNGLIDGFPEDSSFNVAASASDDPTAVNFSATVVANPPRLVVTTGPQAGS